MSQKTILTENLDYWTGRAEGYSQVNQHELNTEQRRKWSDCLRTVIRKQFPDRDSCSLRVLDAGTGPGFFAVILCELGYQVTAIDLTPTMLEKAKQNAGNLAENIVWMEMDTENLKFSDACFDVIVSRNLTWNLPHPDHAYAEWSRVLRPGGLLINFDANWYAYLFSDAAKASYEQDRLNSAEQGVNDQNIGENFDVMEEIARRLPLSDVLRPSWDLSVLRGLGIDASADEQIWQKVWSKEEQLNFASTPLFMITGTKSIAG